MSDSSGFIILCLLDTCSIQIKYSFIFLLTAFKNDKLGGGKGGEEGAKSFNSMYLLHNLNWKT